MNLSKKLTTTEISPIKIEYSHYSGFNPSDNNKYTICVAVHR